MQEYAPTATFVGIIIGIVALVVAYPSFWTKDVGLRVWGIAIFITALLLVAVFVVSLWLKVSGLADERRENELRRKTPKLKYEDLYDLIHHSQVAASRRIEQGHSMFQIDWAEAKNFNEFRERMSQIVEEEDMKLYTKPIYAKNRTTSAETASNMDYSHLNRQLTMMKGQLQKIPAS